MNKTLLCKNYPNTTKWGLDENKKKIVKDFFGLIAFLFHSLLVFYNGPD